MLQFPRGVGLGVDVGNFLQLQASFQAHGVVHAPADEEHVMGTGIFGGKPLNALLVLQHPLDLSGDGLQLV